MPLENATYLHQLEVSNPASTDQVSQADDHLRLIKSALKATFPNFTGPLTASNDALSSTFSMPVGFIGVWYGSSATVPAGWAVCNGQTVNRTDGTGTIATPDLRNCTVIGAGSVAAQGTAVGATTASATTSSSGSHTHSVSGGAHSHSVTVDGHILTVDEMPSHRHPSGVADVSGSDFFVHGSQPASSPLHASRTSGASTVEALTDYVGGGQAHAHTGSTGSSGSLSMTSDAQGDHTHSVSVSTLQPSVGLHYIIKV